VVSLHIALRLDNAALLSYLSAVMF
jgi:hypothetical protein